MSHPLKNPIKDQLHRDYTPSQSRLRHVARVLTVEQAQKTHSKTTGTLHGDVFDSSTNSADMLQSLESAFANSVSPAPASSSDLILQPHRHARHRIRRARRTTWGTASPGAPSSSSMGLLPAANRSSEAPESSTSGSNRGTSSSSAVMETSHAESLRVVMDLWHLYTNHQQKSNPQSRSVTSWIVGEPPRLLTADEEVVLGSIIQQHRKLLQFHRDQPAAAAALGPLPGLDSSASEWSSISNPANTRNCRWPPPLTAADVEEVTGMSAAWRSMLPSLAAKAHQLLVMYNTKLVPHMLQLCRRSDLPAEDMMALGLSGLKKAALRFDPARKTRFSTTAGLWIVQHVQRESDVQRGGIKSPVRHLEMLRHVSQRYGNEVLHNLEQRPDVVQEVATYYKTQPITVLRSLKFATEVASTASLDAPSIMNNTSKGQDGTPLPWAAMLTSTDLDEGDDSDSVSGLSTEGSFMAASGQLPTWLLQQQQQAAAQPTLLSDATPEQQVESLLDVLKPKERAVIEMLYGTDEASVASAVAEGQRSSRSKLNRATEAKGVAPGEPGFVIKGAKTLSAVGRELGWSTERIRQFRVDAFRKLRAAARSRGLSLTGTVLSSTDADVTSSSGSGSSGSTGVGDNSGAIPTSGTAATHRASSSADVFHSSRRRRSSRAAAAAAAAAGSSSSAGASAAPITASSSSSSNGEATISNSRRSSSNSIATAVSRSSSSSSKNSAAAAPSGIGGVAAAAVNSPRSGSGLSSSTNSNQDQPLLQKQQQAGKQRRQTQQQQQPQDLAPKLHAVCTQHSGLDETAAAAPAAAAAAAVVGAGVAEEQPVKRQRQQLAAQEQLLEEQQSPAAREEQQQPQQQQPQPFVQRRKLATQLVMRLKHRQQQQQAHVAHQAELIRPAPQQQRQQEHSQPKPLLLPPQQQQQRTQQASPVVARTQAAAGRRGFDSSLQLLQCYMQAHDGCLPRSQAKWDGVKIGKWVAYKQWQYRNGQLAAGYVAALEALPGWTWQKKYKEHASLKPDEKQQ